MRVYEMDEQLLFADSAWKRGWKQGDSVQCMLEDVGMRMTLRWAESAGTESTVHMKIPFSV